MCPHGLLFFLIDTAATEIYTLSLHDALPIWSAGHPARVGPAYGDPGDRRVHRLPHRSGERSEEHTSELQSRRDLVCRLLLEKKKYNFSSHLSALPARPK